MPQLYQQQIAALTRVQGDLDELLAELQGGAAPGAPAYDRLEERVQRMAADIVAAWRKPGRDARPLKVTDRGAWF